MTGNEDIKQAYADIIERICDADTQASVYGYDRNNLTLAQIVLMGAIAALADATSA